MLNFILQLAVVLVGLLVGIRRGGLALGTAMASAALILILLFRDPAGSWPQQSLILAVSVVFAGAAVEAAGGLTVISQFAVKAMQGSNIRMLLAPPILAWLIVVLTGNTLTVVPLIAPCIVMSSKLGVPVRITLGSMVAAAVSAQVASPVSPVTALVVGGLGADANLLTVLSIAVPATFAGVLALCGRQSIAYLRKPRTRVSAIAVDPTESDATQDPTSRARLSAVIFLAGGTLSALVGVVTPIRPVQCCVDNSCVEVSTSVIMPLIFLFTTMVIMVSCRVDTQQVMKSQMAQVGFVTVVTLAGSAIATSTLISANPEFTTALISEHLRAAPIMLSLLVGLLALVVGSSSTAMAIVLPIATACGVPSLVLVAAMPACGTSGVVASRGIHEFCIEMDGTGSTNPGKYIFDSFSAAPAMLVTLVSSAAAIGISLAML